MGYSRFLRNLGIFLVAGCLAIGLGIAWHLFGADVNEDLNAPAIENVPLSLWAAGTALLTAAIIFLTVRMRDRSRIDVLRVETQERGAELGSKPSQIFEGGDYPRSRDRR